MELEIWLPVIDFAIWSLIDCRMHVFFCIYLLTHTFANFPGTFVLSLIGFTSLSVKPKTLRSILACPSSQSTSGVLKNCLNIRGKSTLVLLLFLPSVCFELSLLVDNGGGLGTNFFAAFVHFAIHSHIIVIPTRITFGLRRICHLIQ